MANELNTSGVGVYKFDAVGSTANPVVINAMLFSPAAANDDLVMQTLNGSNLLVLKAGSNLDPVSICGVKIAVTGFKVTTIDGGNFHVYCE